MKFDELVKSQDWKHEVYDSLFSVARNVFSDRFSGSQYYPNSRRRLIE
jgi:hypothetical protein